METYSKKIWVFKEILVKCPENPKNKCNSKNALLYYFLHLAFVGNPVTLLGNTLKKFWKTHDFFVRNFLNLFL